MTPQAPLQLAIIGSGPSGCYLAGALSRALPEARITIFDRLVSPYGLIRYGVAADHQHTKVITRQFERLFQTGAVRFAGNIDIGRDLPLETIMEHFDATVLATGLANDLRLTIPGSTLPGVLGAGQLTRVLNAHPGEHPELPHLGTDVVVVGAGNVALDVLRFLVKAADDYSGSDIADHALEPYLAAPAERVTLISRSGAAQSKGDPQMIKELQSLPRGRYFTAEPLTEAENGDRTEFARVAALHELTGADRQSVSGPDVTLHFDTTPMRITGETTVTGIECVRGDEVILIPATSIITAVGFGATADDHVAAHGFTALTEPGRLAPGLYRTGWAKRGPRGAIPENRACAKQVAEEIIADLTAGLITPSAEKQGLDALPATVTAHSVDYAEWLRLEEHERALASEHRVRTKLPHHDRMIAVAKDHP